MWTPKVLRTLRLFVVVGAVTFALVPYGISATPSSGTSGPGCAADSQPVQVSSDAMRQLLTSVQQTANPPAPSNVGVGTVVLSIVVDCSGKIMSNKVVSSGSDTMAHAATAAVNAWTYKPYLVNGNPVEVQSTVTISFSTQGKN